MSDDYATLHIRGEGSCAGYTVEVDGKPLYCRKVTLTLDADTMMATAVVEVDLDIKTDVIIKGRHVFTAPTLTDA